MSRAAVPELKTRLEAAIEDGKDDVCGAVLAALDGADVDLAALVLRHEHPARPPLGDVPVGRGARPEGAARLADSAGRGSEVRSAIRLVAQDALLLSGSIHYMRSTPEQWPALLHARTCRACRVATPLKSRTVPS